MELKAFLTLILVDSLITLPLKHFVTTLTTDNYFHIRYIIDIKEVRRSEQSLGKPLRLEGTLQKPQSSKHTLGMTLKLELIIVSSK